MRTAWQEHIGVGEPCRAIPSEAARQPTRRRKVIREVGKDAGGVAGYHTDHKDGRQDAHVFSPLVTKTIRKGSPE